MVRDVDGRSHHMESHLRRCSRYSEMVFPTAERCRHYRAPLIAQKIQTTLFTSFPDAQDHRAAAEVLYIMRMIQGF